MALLKLTVKAPAARAASAPPGGRGKDRGAHEAAQAAPEAPPPTVKYVSADAVVLLESAADGARLTLLGGGTLDVLESADELAALVGVQQRRHGG